MSDEPDLTLHSLSDEEVSILNAARRLLQNVSREATNLGWKAESRGGARPVAASFGRVSQAAETAEDAIFNVLNVASSTSVRPLDENQLHPFRLT